MGQGEECFSMFRPQVMIREYFQERIFLLALVLILFIMGLIFGVLAAGVLEKNQKADLMNYLNQGLHGQITQNQTYTRQTVTANTQLVFFLFFMGISVIGVPLALLLIFTRGFILGFSSGFLFQTMGVKGFVLTMVGIVPHNLLFIPALFLMAIVIMDCAAALTKIRFTKKPVALGPELIKCSALTMVVLVLMILAGIIQSNVSPLITAWFARFI
ncbi:MAG TPA: stage II sporulation protein M [Firmicutes bacterium]|jgi:stage II sporulation protein M|nr:stage II sporulation protein M [Bacillota bacterium]